MAGGVLGRQVQVRWPQHALDRVVQRLFPAEWSDGVLMPCLEDIANMGPFQTYAEWIAERDQQFEDPAAGRKIPNSWTSTAVRRPGL
eukprot:5737091-Heterocapsa_arctica.AAC.1